VFKDASEKATVLALLGNGTVTVAKLTAFALSGSGAMFGEGLHSAADTLNAGLLWLGVRLSRRPPDRRHPFGYGSERYFWSIISALGVFMVGGGATIYHGLHEWVRPEPIHVGPLTWGALALGVLLDGGVFATTLREAGKRRGSKSWREYVASSTDPALLAVLFEDAVDLLGIAIAALGIGLAGMLDVVRFDAAASMLIGGLMVWLALFLAHRNRVLLLGSSAAPEVEKRIREIAVSDPLVGRILALRTRVLAAGQYRVDLQVDFSPDAAVGRLRDEVRSAAPGIRNADDLEAFAQKFARRVVDEMAKDLDALEGRIREAVPGARVIDVEGD
jgi:solute carrier family 30 (zinc transporter), member 9